MRVVAAVPACALLGGAALGLSPSHRLPGAVVGALMAASVLGAVGSLLFGRRRAAESGSNGRSVRRGGGLLLCVVTGFGAGGMLLGAEAVTRADHSPLRAAFDDLVRTERLRAAAEHRLLPLDPSVFAVIDGTLRADATIGPAGVTVSIAVDAIRDAEVALVPERRTEEWRAAAGGVVLGVGGVLAPGRVGEWTSGRRVRVSAELRRPSRYLDPGVGDGDRSLRWRGTDLVGSIKSGALVDVVAAAGRVDEYAAAARAYVRRTIDSAVGRRSAESAAIVKAIVIGDRAGLSDELQRALQDAGTYHVIAISGGNIAILAAVMLTAFRVAGLLGRAAMVVAIVALGLYAVFVGGGPSVDRATWMAIAYLGARAVDHRANPVNSLAVTAAAMVAVQPLALADPAFILTFGATLGILLAAPMLSTSACPRWLRPVAAMLGASAAAELSLVPVGALVFQRVTFAGLVLNFLAIPLMAVAQIAGMVLVPASFVSDRIAHGIGLVAHLGAAGLVRSAGLVAFTPALVFRVAPPSRVAVAAYYGSLIVVLATGRRHRATLVALVVTALAGLWIVAEPWAYVARRGDGRMQVTFLDVGQGDSAFVRFPHGRTLVVDAGGVPGSTFDVGDRVVAPVLRWAGVGRLDLLVLSHGDPDHIGGAPSIVREFRPREIWEGVPVPRSIPLADLRGQAERGGLRWKAMHAGEHLTVEDDVELLVRHPPLPDWERQRVRNDDSVVLELRWREVSVLFTGDIGATVETDLARSLSPARLLVVKVPHHGSLTSSSAEFVRALAPRVAVVSVGRANRFGHPAAPVLERYRDAGVEIFRTDRDGEVTVDTDGRSVRVCTYGGRCSDVRP